MPDIVIKTSKGYHFRQYLLHYVSLEDGFACGKNFENHHPENVTKMSEICKRISMAEFHYSETILLRFTTSNEQKLTSNESKVTRKRAKRNEQQAKSNEQRTKSSASCKHSYTDSYIHTYLFTYAKPYI